MSDFWERGGDGDLMLWLLLPGYMLFDREGRRARWPHLYAAKDQRRKALQMGAVRDDSNIGHNLIDPNCQYGDPYGGGSLCRKCYPEGCPAALQEWPAESFDIPTPSADLVAALAVLAVVAAAIVAAVLVVAR